MSDEKQRSCKYCKRKYRHRKSTQKFCCRQCLYDWMHEFSPQKRPREIRKCQVCEKEFDCFCHASKKYCSLTCYYEDSINRTISDEHKKRISETRKRDWAAGKVYANVQAARTKWYDYVKSDGNKIRLQGTWEVLYATYLDSQNIAYTAHKGTIWYVRSSDNTKRVYLPDFFLIKTNEYIDVKNDYALKIEREKFEDIRKCNPNLKLRLVTRDDLKNLGLLK